MIVCLAHSREAKACSGVKQWILMRRKRKKTNVSQLCFIFIVVMVVNVFGICNTCHYLLSCMEPKQSEGTGCLKKGECIWKDLVMNG